MASVKEETEESKNQEEDKDLADGGNTNDAVEHHVKVEAEEEGVKEHNRGKEGEIEKVEENVKGEEQEKENVKEEEDKKREKKGSRQVKRGGEKAELASPRTPGIERPSRERKTVERFTVNATARGTPVTKPMAIEKNKKRKSKESASKTSNSADVAADRSRKPFPDEVNSMFRHVVGERKKDRMYGCGSMTNTIYSHEMAPRPCRVGSRSSQELSRIREDIEQQNRVIEFLRVELQALQKRDDEWKLRNEMLKSRIGFVEDQVRRLVSGLPQVAHVHLHTQSYDRVLHGRSAFSRGRSLAGSSRPDPHEASSSRGDRFAVSSARLDLRGKRLPASSSYHRTSSLDRMYSQLWVDPSHDFGVHDDADDDDDEDDDDDGAYDDDETQTL